MAKKYVVGIDLGGSKILTALCDLTGTILAKEKVATECVAGEEHVIRKISRSVSQVLAVAGISQEDIAAIGISSPGPLNVAQGIVVSAPILGWQNVPICQILQQKFNRPAYLENDGNAAAFGELLLGAGRGYRNIIYITVSTGIGCGIIIEQKIYHGKHDAAGELGHICIEPEGRMCDCKNRGCYEAYASGTAIERIAKELVPQAQNATLLAFMGNELQQLTCANVARAADAGDPLAISIWREASKRLGQGISILMQLLDPDIVIIGGGVSKAWNLFYPLMLETVRQHTYRLISDDMVIVPAQLGEDAGVLGAVMLAVHESGLKKESPA